MANIYSESRTNNCSSIAALQDILSQAESESDDKNASENESVMKTESEAEEDCEIVESTTPGTTDSETHLSTSSSTANSAVSLLNVLKALRSSDLTRKRKVAVNIPPKGKQ